MLISKDDATLKKTLDTHLAILIKRDRDTDSFYYRYPLVNNPYRRNHHNDFAISTGV